MLNSVTASSRPLVGGCYYYARLLVFRVSVKQHAAYFKNYKAAVYGWNTNIRHTHCSIGNKTSTKITLCTRFTNKKPAGRNYNKRNTICTQDMHACTKYHTQPLHSTRMNMQNEKYTQSSGSDCTELGIRVPVEASL